MSLKAIISDIHANLEALHAVLVDAEKHGVEDIYCLGDVVGYGVDARACVGLAMEWDVCLMGNFDHAALHSPNFFGAAAERSVLWAQNELKASDDRYFAFMATWPETHREEDLLFAHGSPRNPKNEYVFPEDVYHSKKLEAIFDLIPLLLRRSHAHAWHLWQCQ